MATGTLNPRSWLYPTPRGYREPGGFYRPAVAVDRALITHGHGDHARPTIARALATAETWRSCAPVSMACPTRRSNP